MLERYKTELKTETEKDITTKSNREGETAHCFAFVCTERPKIIANGNNNNNKKCSPLDRGI